MPRLRIIGGRAGQLMPWLLRDVDQKRGGGQPIVLLVPEQYTLQAERELVEGLDLPGLMDIDVLSPRRLLTRVRERGGAGPKRPLDEKGRLMAISQALRQCRESLQYYGGVAEQPGLPAKISVVLSDLERAGMDAEALFAHAQEQKSAARLKEGDLALVWRAYDDIISQRFADEITQQREMLERVSQSGVLTGAHVYVYGFDVLQTQMCELLCRVGSECASCAVLLVMSARGDADQRIFYAQHRSCDQLAAMLEEGSISYEIDYLDPEENAMRAPALNHLERFLFARAQEVFTGDTDCVRIHASANPYAEAAYAAQTLRKWHEEGIPWQRMAVALAEGNTLPGIVDDTLTSCGIPHYVARKDSAMRHGLCRMLLGAMRAATGGFMTADVIEVMKSGFSPIEDREAMRLENYALENGINRGKWLRPFTRGEAAGEMEGLRQRLIAPMAALHDRLLHAKNAASSMEAVYRLLEDTSAYEKLMRREEALLALGKMTAAAQNRQVWRTVMELLDQLHALLGERRASMKDVAGLMEAGLSNAAISALPPEPDTVMVGETGHLLTGEIDALLMMGMQDGVMASTMDSLITDRERTSLTEFAHRMVGMSQQEQSALRQSDFYRTMSLPQKRLMLTYAEGGQDGTAMQCAGLVMDVKRLLGLTISGGVTATGLEEAPLSPLTALEGLALRLRAMADGVEAKLDEAWLEALKWLWQQDEWHDRTLRMLDSLDARVEGGMLTGAQTRRVFSQDAVSISRLEEFAACPFRHFVDYGLKPVVRRPFAFEADERGQFYHSALQAYASLAASRSDWPNIADEDIDAMMDEVLRPLEAQWQDGPLCEDAVGRKLGEEYVRTVRRAAWMFTRHARNSRFTTMGAEVRFGGEGALPPVILPLKDGRRIALRGVIDRIDRYDGDEGLYLRVVDYKSSQHALDPVRMWYGLQLQLLLYLKAAEQSVEGALPAGAFYFTVQDPMVSAPEDAVQETERLLAKEMRLKGVVLAQAEVVEAMDQDEPGYSIGKVFNKDGSIAAGAQAYDLEGMRGLLEHARTTAAELADRIREGCIEIAPAQIEHWTACDYCPHAAICGRDSKRPGGACRVLESGDKQEFLSRMTNKKQ